MRALCCLIASRNMNQSGKASCPTCGKLISASHLNRHVQEAHALKRSVLVCPECCHEEPPNRPDSMRRHIAKSHTGCSHGPQMVGVPPYRAFRYCLVPGCCYRTASDRQHRLHMRGAHPAWFVPPQAPVATTSSPAAVTAASTATVTPTVARVTSA